MTNTRENPYVGPHAFEPKDQKKFAGRDRDITALYRLLIAERIVLLFSPSGAGKSSLVNAGLLPRMIEKGFKILPVVRVNLPLPGELTAKGETNRYVMSMLQALEDARSTEQEMSNEQLTALTINDYLLQHLRPADASGADDEAIIEPKSFLIFDQFEEILTIDPNDDKGKREFFAQLGDALEESRRWALFVVREDYVAALDPYLRLLPTRLATTYRLDLLDYESAMEAVRKPAGLMKVSYTDEAAEHLINELRSVRIQRPDGSWEPELQLGRYVEPVQLQVVCYRLWDKIGEAATITEEDVSKLGSVDESLAGYYADMVTETEDKVHVTQKDIRTWFDTALITPNNIRSQVMWEEGQSGGLSNDAILYLEKTHLIRGESRRGIKWLELAHDRMIKPVRDNNKEWFEKNLSVLQRQAMLWESEGEPERLLLRYDALTEAEAWAKDKTLSPNEKKFLEACTDLRQRDQAEASKKEAEALAITNKRLRTRSTIAISAAVIAGILAVLAIISGITAVRQTAVAGLEKANAEAQSTIAANQAQSAEDQAKNAQDQAKKAQEESNRSLSLNLALNGSALIDKNPPLAALLWLESLNYASIPQAEQNLRDLLGVNHAYLLSGHANAITHTVFSPDGQWLVTTDAWSGSEDNTSSSVRIWNMGTQDPSRVYAVPNQLGRSDWTALAISPDNQWLVLGEASGWVVIYEFTKAGRIGAFQTQPDQQVTALAFGHNGGKDWLAVGSADGTVALVDFSEESLAPVLSENGQPNFITLNHGTQKVNKLAFSKDGRWLAAGSDDFQVRVWDVKKPGSTSVPHLQKGKVVSLAYSADYLVAYGNSNMLYIYNAQEPVNNPLTFTAPSVFDITALAFDPANPDRLAIGQADGTIQFFDIASFSPSPEFSESSDTITHLAFTEDGRWLVSAAKDRNVRLWNVNRLDGNGVVGGSTILKTFEDDITSVQFSPGGKWLAAGSADHSVALWDLRSGFDPIEPVTLSDAGKSMDFPSISFDGKWLAAIESDANTNTLKVWSAEKFASGDRRSVLTVDDSASYAFSPNGNDLAVGIRKNNVVSIELFDLQNPGKAARLVTNNLENIGFLAFSPVDGHWLAAYDSDKKEAYIWDTANFSSKPVVYQLGDSRLDYVFWFSPKGNWLAAVSGSENNKLDNVDEIYLLNMVDPSKTLAYSSDGGGVSYFAFSPDERWFSVGTAPKTDSNGDVVSDGHAFLWDLAEANPAPVRLEGHTGAVTTVEFDISSQLLATGDDAGIVRLWNISESPPSLVQSLPPYANWVVQVSFSPDGKWLVSDAADGSIDLWSMDKVLSNPQEGYYALNGHEAFVTSLVFSPKNDWLASSSGDRTIRLWNLSEPYSSPIILKGSVDEVYTAAFSPDERLLLSNTYNGDARLWHLDVNDLKSLACDYARRNMSKEEWEQYVGLDRPYQKTCEELPDYVEPTPLPEVTSQPTSGGDGSSPTPTPEPQLTPTATPGQACSLNADVSVNLTFVNNSDKMIDVYWVDYECNRQPYATLAPGDSYVQGTFATHPWVFIDAETGDVLKQFVAGTADEEVTIP